MLKPIFGVDFGTFPIYAIMLLLGGFVALIMLNCALGRAGYSPFMKKRIRRSFFWSALVGFLCANVANWFLFEGMLDWSLYARLTQGGLSFLFGLLPFFLCSALLLRLHKVQVKEVMNLVVGPLLIAHFFGRLGCSLRGCCWGQSLSFAGTEILLPVREVEAIALLIMGIVIPKKSKEKTLWVYLLSYGLLRFVLEFFRGDSRGCLFGITALSPSQVVCLALIGISGVALLFRPVVRGLRAEGKLEELKQKLRFRRKDGSVYTPRPANYEEPKKKAHPLKIALRIIALLLVAAILFVYLNPLQLNWCYDLKTKAEEWFSFLHASNSTQQQIGESNGTDMLPISYPGAVDLESGLEIVSNSDTWAKAEFAPMGEKELASGGKILTYCQTIDAMPVLGATRSLLTDAESKPTYMLSDGAGLAFARNEIENYVLKGNTLKELFGKSVKITKTLDCWYDTGRGLLAAEHVLFRVGKGNVAGAVLQKSDKKVVCLTQAELGVLPVANRGDLLSETNSLLKELQEEAKPDKVNALSDLALSGTLLSNSSRLNMTDAQGLAEQAMQMLRKRVGALKQEQCIAILWSVRDVLSVSPTANPKLFCQVFVQQTEVVMANLAFSQEEIAETSKFMKAYLEQFYPKQIDEAAVGIDAQEKEKTFTYGFQYTLDADIYRVTSQAEHALYMTVTTQRPAQVEIYDADGRAVTGMFVEESETFTMYPEDGTEFTVRHMEQADGYLVKVNIRVARQELLICNSFCLFRLQPLKEGDLPVEIQQVQGYMGLADADYCITESNTEALLEAFGETWDSLFVSSDLTSLYRFCQEDERVIDDTLSLRQVRFDKETARKYGHSDKKIDAFEVYVARQNWSILRCRYLELKFKASTYRTLATLYDVYDLLSDPLGAWVESWDNEFASEVYDVISSASPEDYIEGKIKDEVEGKIFGTFKERAEKMEAQCEILEQMIAECEQVING